MVLSEDQNYLIVNFAGLWITSLVLILKYVIHILIQGGNDMSKDRDIKKESKKKPKENKVKKEKKKYE